MATFLQALISIYSFQGKSFQRLKNLQDYRFATQFIEKELKESIQLTQLSDVSYRGVTPAGDLITLQTDANKLRYKKNQGNFSTLASETSLKITQTFSSINPLHTLTLQSSLGQISYGISLPNLH